MISIYLLNNINFVLLNKKNIIYLFNRKFFFSFYSQNCKIFFNKNLKILKIKFLKNFYKQKNISNLLNHFLFTWETFFFKKVKFSGKGYKLKKLSNNLIFFFNHSHIIKYINKNTYIKKLHKTKLIFFFKNYSFYKLYIKNLLNIRFLSTYTKRGLRIHRQLVLKRKGKNN